MSTWSKEPENTGYIDPKEVAPRVDLNGEVVDLVRAESMHRLGMQEKAMELYDLSISKGSYEARMCKGFAIAESALCDGCYEDMVKGLKLAIPVAMRLMHSAQGKRLLQILQMAVDAGWIQGDSQLCPDAVSHTDVYDRMEDFTHAGENEKASLSNLYEYLVAFYR